MCVRAVRRRLAWCDSSWHRWVQDAAHWCSDPYDGEAETADDVTDPSTPTRIASGPNEALGQLLARLRSVRGFGQKQLADLAGIDNSTLSRLESGGRGVSREVLDRLCAALGLSRQEELEVMVAADLLSPEAARLLADQDLVRLGELLLDPAVDLDDARHLRQFLELALAFADARGYRKR